MTAPCDLSAVEARRRIGRGDLSPVELLDSCIARIETIDPAVNAMVARSFERAREEARAAEAALARGDALGPLHGLPLGVKDLEDTAGLRTTHGSRIYAEHVPEEDDAVVARLRAAGAIVVGKTNTPEFGSGGHTVNHVYGATRNPFDLGRTCGGSSGGSAVAVATGMVPLATGSDTGGSLRTPAAFCGITSIRPTPGLVASDRRSIGLSTFGVRGPMARTVADAALMLSAMAAPLASDPLALPTAPSGLDAVEPVDLSRLRLVVSEDLGFAEIDHGMRAVFRARVAEIEPAFRVCERRDPDMRHASHAFWYVRGVHYLAAHAERYAHQRALLGNNVVTNYEAALGMDSGQIAWGMAEQTRIHRAFQSFLDDADVLVCPATAVPPFPIEHPYCMQLNGRPVETYIQWLDIVAGITLTGHPVVTLPCGRDPTGTPFGIQVVGPRRHAERFVIGVAAALEARLAEHADLARPVPDVAALARARAGAPEARA